MHFFEVRFFFLQYSSWSETLKHNFRPIRVTNVQGNKGNETVEVIEKYKPKPQDTG